MRGERREPYKEDSTRGLSMINPLNYKGDVLVQVWVDSRVLATLCRWLDKNNTYAVHLSQIVRRPLEVLVDLITRSGDAELVDNTIEARELLQRRFKVDLSRGGRGTKNVMHNIELSIRREDLTERIQSDKRYNDVSRPAMKSSRSALVEEATKKYKELFPDLKERGNSPEVIEAHIKVNDEIAQQQLDELNSLDPLSLLNKSVK